MPEHQETSRRGFLKATALATAAAAAFRPALTIAQQSATAANPLPKEVVASAFANRELYLALANYGRSSAEVQTTEPYVAVADASAGSRTSWTLAGRSLRILRRSR